MKKLIYQVEGYTGVYNPETEEVEKKVCISTVTGECPTQTVLDANYAIAEKNAIPGTIEVTGEFDPEGCSSPTLETRVATLETDTADMAEALDMILSGVTE